MALRHFQFFMIVMLFLGGLAAKALADECIIPSTERSILIDFYDSTGGDDWNNTSYKWKSLDDFRPPGTEDDWWGVGVNPSLCRVWSIKFPIGNNLVGIIPASIQGLGKMRELHLHNNKITSIPENIKFLTNLTSLRLEGNQLTEIPGGIGNLHNLELLWLNNNQITELPWQIGDLSSLESLRLQANQLTELPAQIGNLSSLGNLNLMSNQLTGLPPEIGNLENLLVLNLGNVPGWESSGNQLTELPAQIGNLTNLSQLDLSGNQLTQLPSEIGNLVGLSMLSLNNNRLSDLPSTITSLSHMMLNVNVRDNCLINITDPEVRSWLDNLDPEWEEHQDNCLDDKYTITVLAEPDDGGTVTGGSDYDHGEEVTVTATANTGYIFVNWTENGQDVSTEETYIFTAETNRVLTANFSIVQDVYEIVLVADPQEGGAVAGGGTYDHGTSVTVTATSSQGWSFTGWTEGGAYVSTEAVYVFAAQSDRTLTAHFREVRGLPGVMMLLLDD